jgi:protein-tyrosine phosphatase
VVDRPYRVCLVCLGNICRSPMAAVVLRRMLARAGLAESVVVDSAGTGSWHVGEPADPRALAALRDRGYDGSHHRARQFTARDFAEFDLVLALDNDNLATLRRLAPDANAQAKVEMFGSYDPHAQSPSDFDVPDPYYGGSDGFTHVLNQVERAAAGLATTLQEELRDR